MAKEIQNIDEKKQSKGKYKYLTLVLKYYDKGTKNSYDVTEVVTTLIESLRSYNHNCSYDDYRFDLYGICVEEDTDIASGKNEFVNSINEIDKQ